MPVVNRGVGVTPGYLDREDLSQLLGGRYEVPTFQRGYAWGDSNIDDYVGDLLEHFSAARAGRRYDAYFFGAVVTIRRRTGLGRGDQIWDVIDGQQRLTTFYLTLAALRREAARIEAEAAAAGDAKPRRKAKAIREAMDTFLGDLPDGSLRFAPAGVDEAYYRSVITNGPGNPLGKTSPYGHRRLRSAAEKLDGVFIESLLEGASSNSEELKRLDTFAQAFLDACYVIHAGSEDEVDAYRLFLVLNDRGLELTEADLLKTHTLALLRAHRPEADKAKRAWESIVTVKPQTQKGFLRAYWSMMTGKRPQSRDLHRQYQDTWFKQRPKGRAEAKTIADRVEHMAEAFQRFKALSNSHWPYDPPSADRWTQDRLARLVRVLGSDTSLPLLMALSYGREARFSDGLLYLERFVFRYNLSGGHKSSLGNRIFDESAKALSDPTWSVASLRPPLAPLAAKYATDERFKAALETLRYSGSKILVRHLLTTLDDYSAWYGRGAGGQPKPSKLKVFTLDRGDIDHIYPERPQAGYQDAALDTVRDFVGNLAYLDEGDNRSAGNDPFAAKQLAVYTGAAAQLTSDLADTTKWPQWTLAEYERRRDEIIAMALKVFRIT